MTFDSEELLQYLSLSNLIEMRYLIDTDDLEIFRIAAGEKQVLYRGALEGWVFQVGGGAHSSAQQKTKDFCQDIRDGKEAFLHEFQVDDHLYRIHCRVEATPNGNVCYGTVDAVGNAEEICFRRASDRDAMLDMLNKRAITEYAKSRFNHPELTTFLVILDLDNFKMVNDTYGHMYGDSVLVTFTDIINKAMGSHGTVGRIGGDEILIVTKDIPDKEALRPYLREIRTNMELTYKGKLPGISLTCSIGAAAFPEHAATYEETMELADKMLYLAKEKGRNRYLIYTPELHRDYVQNHSIGPGVPKPLRQYDNIGIMHYMLSEYLDKQSSTNEFVFDQLGRAFRLGEILCIYNWGTLGFRWSDDGEGLRQQDMAFLSIDDPFLDHVDEDGLFLMDGRYLIKDQFPQMYQKLEARKVEAAIFYRIRSQGQPYGYVMFAKHQQRQKWSEYEVMSLSIAAKIFELSAFHGRNDSPTPL